MKYKSEIQKFVTSQYLYSGFRIALAIVIPSIILAYFGLLKDFFLFPLATSFVGLTDQPGPFIRRRNSLILAIVVFSLVAGIASLLKNYPPLIFLEIIFFGIFFSMIGVYGQRLASVGGLALVVLSIFIDGHLTGDNIAKSLIIFTLGSVWFLIVFLVAVKLQPYKLAGQMIGENYLELADYLKLKAKFYNINQDVNEVYSQVISKQIVIKNLQEETRELVFKTRTMVNESTTSSRLLMLMFLNSIDFYEKLLTSEQDYKKIRETFGETDILSKIHDYLLLLSEEIINIGIALQSGSKTKSLSNIEKEHQKIYDEFSKLRNRTMTSETLENFMTLRMILLRINDISDDIKTIYKVFSQDTKNAKSLSTGLDFDKFVPKQEKLNSKVFFNNFSLKSSHFRHAIRITLALLLGYGISKFHILGIGHSYWILITIVAIMRPAYSTTKHRNLLRLYGTTSGAIVAYFILYFFDSDTFLLSIMLGSMIFCFALLKGKYSWAVFFMTIYIFIAFNFLNPGNINAIFKDRILDTMIAGIIVYLVSYFVLPVWEHTQNKDLMYFSTKANLDYFQTVMQRFGNPNSDIHQYKIKRKDAIIHLANMSDNFQRMLSDPKHRQKKLEVVHQFVNTSHLVTAYIASLSLYNKNGDNFPEIDLDSWNKKITSELARTAAILENKSFDENIKLESRINPDDNVEDLLMQRKSEIEENEFFDIRDPKRITYLTELKNIREILLLIYDVTKEQRKVTESYRKLV
ncbi:MAG: FUSC family membrane protein [Cruoricaptor ignavus]|nr:FUSC family membrane protein [Cruoricaptor ignavus]